MMAMAAISAMTITVSCDSDYEPSGFYSEVNISNSSVSLDTLGGTTSTEVYAENAWEIQGVPSWLPVSPLSGNAGKTIVNFSAESTKAGRGATLKLVSADKTQYINVIQGLLAASDATCAEIIAGPDSKKYRAKGICTAIANTSYGNWYLRDNTGEIYIYGTLDKNGKSQNFLSLGIEVGDEVTVEGPKKTYNGTVELVDVMVVRINKSLIKIESGGAQSFSANGGDFMVQLTVKGDGPTIELADNATAEWIGISSIVKTDTTTNVTFHVAPNQSEQSRQAIINFTSKSDKSSSTVSATVDQMGLMGTLTNPFTVADAIAYCQQIGSTTSANEFYVKGKISSIKEVSPSYGNATFNISDDGTDENALTCYRALSVGNQKFVAEDEIHIGDQVLMVGKLVNYNNTTPQMAQGCYIYSLVAGPRGDGSLESPFNIAGAMKAIDDGVTTDVFVEGVVSKFANNGEYNATYGNGTFWISDNGTFYDDLTMDFEVYRALWLGNKKWEEGDYSLVVGDKVVVCGSLTKYGSTYETSSGKAYVYSVNGKTE